MKIFSGNAHSKLAKKIAAHLGHELANVEVTSFPERKSQLILVTSWLM